jgi:hypothetical protein
MNVYTAPQAIPHDAPRPWIFLAGSIEQDKAEPWQAQVIEAYKDQPGTLINPRRAEWDASWTFDNPKFQEQVHWELDHLDAADAILMYFDPKTKSPITLLELGLYVNTGKVFVSCTPEFWRYGNVQIVCERANVFVHETLPELIAVTGLAAAKFSTTATVNPQVMAAQ